MPKWESVESEHNVARPKETGRVESLRHGLAGLVLTRSLATCRITEELNEVKQLLTEFASKNLVTTILALA